MDPGADQYETGGITSSSKAKKSKKDKIARIPQTGDGSQLLEPFDYSTVPNLLDDGIVNDEDADSRQKGQKRKKGRSRDVTPIGRINSDGFAGAAPEYGSGAGPRLRAYREVKSGNKTYTFK